MACSCKPKLFTLICIFINFAALRRAILAGFVEVFARSITFNKAYIGAALINTQISRFIKVAIIYTKLKL